MDTAPVAVSAAAAAAAAISGYDLNRRNGDPMSAKCQLSKSSIINKGLVS